VHPQAELRDDPAEVGQVLLAGRFGLVGRQQRNAGDLDALVAAEPASLRGPPGNRLADGAGIENLARHAPLLAGDRQFQPDRPGAHNDQARAPPRRVGGSRQIALAIRFRHDTSTV